MPEIEVIFRNRWMKQEKIIRRNEACLFYSKGTVTPRLDRTEIGTVNTKNSKIVYM